MPDILNTEDLKSRMEYFDSPSSFFSNFANAWQGIRSQVLKLETKQSYIESGLNLESFTAFLRKDFDRSDSLMLAAREDNKSYYRPVVEEKVDFIRTRLIVHPLTDYLKWEIRCYYINESLGEKIYFTDRKDIFNELARHDFMIFDDRVVLMHDYDNEGQIRGGWKSTDAGIIRNMLATYSIIRASSWNYHKYLAKFLR